MHTFGSLTINRDETDGGARGVDPLMGNAAIVSFGENDRGRAGGGIARGSELRNRRNGR